MTTNIVYANASDGQITSHSTSLATALDGANKSAASGGTTVKCGTSKTGSTYYAYEAFESFTFSVDAGEHVAAAHVRLYAYASGGTEALELREFNWGASADTGDWRTRAQLGALTEYAPVGYVSSTPGTYASGSDALLDAIRDGGTVYVVGCTYNQRTTSYTGQQVTWYAADASGTTNDPALVYSTVTSSTLDRFAGAQVQLSDGTWVILDADGDETPSVSGCSVNEIDEVDTGATSTVFGYPAGMQAFALVADDEDNLYLLGKVGNADNTLAVVAYKASSGWTAGTIRTAALPAGPGAEINQVAATWHDTGTAGTIVAVVAHGYADPDGGTDVAYLLLNCDYLLNGTGSLLRGSGDAHSASLVSADSTKETVTGAGTLLDVTAGSALRGFVTAANTPGGSLGSTGNLTVSRYILATGGASLSAIRSTSINDVTIDVSAKARTLAVDGTRVILVYADPAVGLVVEDLQNIGTASTFTALGTVAMDAESLSTLPTGATLATSPLWDAVYDSASNSVRLYYFDDGDNRRLMYTTVDMSTHLAAGDENEVDAAVGAAGSTNLALRIERSTRATDYVLVSVANKAADGTLTTIGVAHQGNVAPEPPTLTAHGNFDADVETVFYWTFNDPNASDVQSAYQLVIIDTSDDSTAYDSTKTTTANEYATLPAATIDNDGDYQWRVKTWDPSDEASDWSSYGTFSTSSSGTVDITDPTVDPTPNTSSYTVTWEVAGATQDAYRVVVTDTSDSSTLVDTGWVTGISGTNTSYLIAGMSSDTTYSVAVTARDSGVETNTDTATITPDYATPQTPSITLSDHGADGYILVEVVNPIPEGDEPDVDTNTILRRLSGTDGDWVEVGQTLDNDEYRDYAAGAGVVYEYKARADASSGVAESSTDTESATMLGVWVHDPADPDGTARQYAYRGSNGKSSLSQPSVSTHYAGRTYPVVDYGEHRDDVLSVTLAVSFGATHAADMAAIREFVRADGNTTVRDPRGRVFTGPLTSYGENDEAYGTVVSFSVTQTTAGGV